MNNAVNPDDFWLLRPSFQRMLMDVREYDDDGNDLHDEPESTILNLEELDQAEQTLRDALPMTFLGQPYAPESYPTPQLFVPEKYDYDFVEQGAYLFISKRMRDALAQSDDVVQYLSIALIDSTDLACARDYMLMRVLRWQHVLDLTRSAYDTEKGSRADSGETKVYYWINRFEPLPVSQHPAVFRGAETQTDIFVTDAVAERVMRAGCTGVSFRDPRTDCQRGRMPQRLRVANGIAFEDLDLAEAAG